MVTPLARGRVLRAALAAPVVDLRTLTGGRPVMVLAPHPDDETFGCGAALAAAAAAGLPVIVVAVTDGTRSHPASRRWPPAMLAQLRLAELRAALRRLAGRTRHRIIELGFPDQGAPAGGAGMARACGRVVALARQARIGALWTTWDGDPHIDHRRTAAFAARVAAALPGVRFWRFPVWGRFTETAPVPSDRLYRFDGTGFRQAKRAAIRCYRSQVTRLIADDPDGFVMAPETCRHFLQTPELFIGSVRGGPHVRA